MEDRPQTHQTSIFCTMKLRGWGSTSYLLEVFGAGGLLEQLSSQGSLLDGHGKYLSSDGQLPTKQNRLPDMTLHEFLKVNIINTLCKLSGNFFIPLLFFHWLISLKAPPIVFSYFNFCLIQGSIPISCLFLSLPLALVNEAPADPGNLLSRTLLWKAKRWRSWNVPHSTRTHSN